MTMWIDRVNLPASEGFYWGRTSGSQWWNLIVHVYGNAPFFSVDVWKYADHILFQKASVYDIEEFGPQIAVEAPEIESEREDWR